MKSIIKKQITLAVPLFIALSSYTYAESTPNLPQSTQVTHESNESSKVEIVEEISIKVENNELNKNPNLKEGKGCENQALEPAELTPDEYEDIPMAQTIPCDTVNCNDLESARLTKDIYKKIPMAKTTKLESCIKK